MKWLCGLGGFLVACGPGHHDASQSDASNDELIFEDTFESFFQDGRWNKDIGPDLDRSIGNPSPSIVFPNESHITLHDPLMFDGRRLTTYVDFRVQSQAVGAIEMRLLAKTSAVNGTQFAGARLRFVGNSADNSPIGGYPAGASMWMSCDSFAGEIETQVDPKDGFYRVQLVIESTGFRCGVDGVEYDSSNVSLDAQPYHVDVRVTEGTDVATTVGTVHADNVRVYRALQ
jgi:hypothetical protein